MLQDLRTELIPTVPVIQWIKQEIVNDANYPLPISFNDNALIAVGCDQADGPRAYGIIPTLTSYRAYSDLDNAGSLQAVFIGR